MFLSVMTNTDEVKKDDDNSESDSYEQSVMSLSRLEHRLNIADLQKLNEVYEVQFVIFFSAESQIFATSVYLRRNA
jgi:hypothetical protein